MSANRLAHWKIDAAAVGLVAGLTAIAVFAHVVPTLSRFDAVEAQSTQLASQQAKAREQERTILIVKDQLVKAEAAAAASQLRLEPVTELNRRLARLTDLAAENGLQVDTIERGATADFPKYSTVAIRISGKGSYRNCTNLLKQIRITMPDVGATSLDLSGAAVNADPVVTFGFDLLWYTQPQGPAPRK